MMGMCLAKQFQYVFFVCGILSGKRVYLKRSVCVCKHSNANTCEILLYFIERFKNKKENLTTL